MSAEVQVDVTRLTMTVGEVSFELEWKSVYVNGLPGTYCQQWEVKSQGSDLTACRATLEDAKALVMTAAPVIVELNQTRKKVSELAHQLRDLEVSERGGQVTTDDEPPF